MHAVFLKHKPGRLTRAQLPTGITFTTITPASLPTLLQHVYRPALNGKENSALHALQTTLQASSDDATTTNDDALDHEYRTAAAIASDATVPPAIRQRASALAAALAPLATPWPRPASLEATSGHLHDLATALDNAWQLGQLTQARMETVLQLVGRQVCLAAKELVYGHNGEVGNVGNAGQLVAAWQQHVHQLSSQWLLVNNPPWESNSTTTADARVQVVATRLGKLLTMQETCRELQGLLSAEEAAVVGLDAAAHVHGTRDLPLLEVCVAGGPLCEHKHEQAVHSLTPAPHQTTPYATSLWQHAMSQWESLVTPMERLAATKLTSSLQEALLAAGDGSMQPHRLAGHLRKWQWLLRRPAVRGALRGQLEEVARHLEHAVDVLQGRVQQAWEQGDDVAQAVVIVRAQRELQLVVDAVELLGDGTWWFMLLLV